MRSRPLVALALVMLATGCGHETRPGPKDPGGPATDPGGKIVTVEMKDILFVPERITATVGETVLWTNRDDVQHTVKAVKGARFASKTLSQGDTYAAKLTRAGTIDYVCTIHPGQRGTITVVPR